MITMSGISRIIGLRLVGTTKYITKPNTTKYLQSMCQVRNRCTHTTKNPITPAKKQSAGYWKTMKIYSVPFIVMNIAIYWAYNWPQEDKLDEINLLPEADVKIVNLVRSIRAGGFNRPFHHQHVEEYVDNVFYNKWNDQMNLLLI